ncbi:MAG: DUF1572 family protein [Phycisphaerales bacterium]
MTTPDDSNASIAELTLESVIRRFRAQKKLAERAIEQLSDDQLRISLHNETNSVAVIMKHMAGNMISRWTDFLSSDGEKPDRDRDAEFVDDFDSRADMMKYWERGWSRLFKALEDLKPGDLRRLVTIRGHEHTVIEAIHRQLDHYGYHIGQIVLTARMVIGDGAWETLSIARGASEQYNQQHWKGGAPERRAN